MNSNTVNSNTGNSRIPGRTAIPDETEVVVVGAGIAGLCAGLAAAERGARVVVIDAHEPGGRAATAERNGFRLNVGPHALYRGGHLSATLAARGINLPGGVVAGKEVGVALDGEIRRVTLGPLGVMRNPVLRPGSRVRMAAFFARLRRLNADGLSGRSVSDWLGEEPDDLRQFVEMFVRLGSYTHAPEQFDAGAAAGQLQLALKGVRYLDGGWIRLIDALRHATETAGATLISRAAVDAITTDGASVVVRVGNQSVRARAVVVATGGPDVAARLTGGEIANREGLTEPITANCLDLGMNCARQAFVLGMDQPLYMSSHAPLADLAPKGCGLISLIRYLSPGELPGDPTAARGLLREFAQTAGIGDRDVLFERPLHRMVVAHGAPTAEGGGLQGRPKIDALALPGVYIAGDWVGPTGLLADASAASGEQAGRAAVLMCASIRS